LKGLFAEARKTNQHLQQLLKSPKKDSQMANIAASVAQLNRTLLRIDKLVSSQTPQIEQTLEDLKQASANLKELTESLKKHPSELIFSQPPPKSETVK
jgi:phospholipid/cholesterol/gamma-HCH transport system substrate-binding protein/paraquat-inducible protein B